MKTLFAKAGLALALGATALTVAVPAQAQRYDRGYRHHNNGDTAIVAGIAGLAIGAAIASSGRNDGYYEPDYYYDGGGYGYGYDQYSYRDYRPVYPQRYYNQRYYSQRYYNGYNGYRNNDRGHYRGDGRREGGRGGHRNYR